MAKNPLIQAGERKVRLTPVQVKALKILARAPYADIGQKTYEYSITAGGELNCHTAWSLIRLGLADSSCEYAGVGYCQITDKGREALKLIEESETRDLKPGSGVQGS
jgi:hypothetical protein